MGGKGRRREGGREGREGGGRGEERQGVDERGGKEEGREKE